MAKAIIDLGNNDCIRKINEIKVKVFLELLLIVFYTLVSNVMLSCSNGSRSVIKKRQNEVVNYIPQPGISITDNRLVWSNKNSLPSPFAKVDGTVVTSIFEWENRRNVLQKMLEEFVYGTRPVLTITNVEESSEYKDSRVSDNAITYTVKIYYDDLRFFNVRITRPDGDGKYPVIMRYESNEDFRFPIETECIKNKRYVIVALNNLSVAPDIETVSEKYMNETKVLMAWAYAASLTVDYLETLDFTDCTKIAIAGMSRTGKSAICAGIYDTRFTIIIANNSGSAGASGFRSFGEKNTQAINIVKHEPTWVSEKLNEYLDNAYELPLDMHFARALIAPRVILSTEASNGKDAIWAGPVSTFKLWKASDYTFKLYDKTDNNLIHIREGEHAQLLEDYDRMMNVVNHVCYGDSFEPASFRKEAY